MSPQHQETSQPGSSETSTDSSSWGGERIIQTKNDTTLLVKVFQLSPQKEKRTRALKRSWKGKYLASVLDVKLWPEEEDSNWHFNDKVEKYIIFQSLTKGT